MIVIIHQTVDMAEPVKALRHFVKNLQEKIAVIIRIKNRVPSIAAGGDMVNSSAVF